MQSKEDIIELEKMLKISAGLIKGPKKSPVKNDMRSLLFISGRGGVNIGKYDRCIYLVEEHTKLFLMGRKWIRSSFSPSRTWDLPLILSGGEI